MAKIPVDNTDYLAETLRALRHAGCLLASQGAEGKPNAMTIGWGTVGIIWGKPVFIVLVRHSRYTWSRLEENGEFTVNVPPPSLADAATLCGTKSGRDLDKLAAAGLTPIAAQHVGVPVIAECAVHYECRVLHKNNVDPTNLAKSVLDSATPRATSTPSTTAKSSASRPTRTPARRSRASERSTPWPRKPPS